MDSPIPDLVVHRLGGFVADTGREVNEELAMTILRSPWSKGISKKIKP
jgi:hypothetical protein